MSGQQIGTVIGGAIGAYFGGPAGAQLGMAIGGAIGGAVDPTRINGPHLGDGQQQTATDGSPIAWVLGTALVAGTIVQVSTRREVKVKDSGKGGPVVSHYEGRQDFAILVCESCSLRDSTMSSVLMVLQDGVIVYDVRPGSTILSQSYKWAAGVDFMFGDEAQMPHPTLEAITGVGNTPAYRGSLVAVFKNFNTSAAGGRIPTFHFLVSSTVVPTPYVKWQNSGGEAAWPTFDIYIPNINEGDLIVVYLGYAQQFGTDPIGGIPASWTVQDSNTAGNNGCWMCITKIATSSGGELLSLTGTQFGSGPYGAWTYQAYIIAAGSYAPSTLAFERNSSGTLPPTLSLSGGGGSLFIANAYDARYVAPITAWPADHANLEIDQEYTDYYGGAKTAIMATTVQTSTGLSPTWTGPFSPVDYGASTLGVSRSTSSTPVGVNSLADIVTAICKRGGLSTSDIDVSALGSLTVLGYPIARQTTGADALLPLLSAYFAFGSEQDAKLVFDLYGGNVSTTIDAADLIEGNDANHNAIKWTKRNQATEYPRRMVAGYMDPAQNYTIVNVAAERRASGVTAIGDQTFAIPVVMAANDAAQAVDKALKVAYATLEGTAEYSVPFAQSACYLTLTAGDPIFFSGKRYVLDDMIVSNGYLKLTTRYDRQGAYTSDVQAIPGNAPSTPPSRYSGPTTLIPMNLPALRPQDSVGIYVAAGSSTGSADWRGCDVQISYDGMETWQAATTIYSEADIGQFAAAEPTGGEPLTVDLFAGDLISATTAQLAANANVFAIVGANGASEIAQFATATESTTTPGEYALTDISRALGGTPSTPVTTAMRFAQMDAAYFIPIDPIFAGRTLYLRGVGFGEVAEGAIIEPVVFTAIVATPGTAMLAEDNTPLIAEDNVNLIFTER